MSSAEIAVPVVPPFAESFVLQLESWGDYCNPIVVKEVRQALKSAMFLGAFVLCLFFCWIATCCGLILVGDQVDYLPLGAIYFRFFYGILSLAVVVVVPFGAYRSLLTERDESTFEMLSITALTPGRIIMGKLQSAFVQMLLFYAAIAPFIAFSSLLQGFDVVQMALNLATGVVCSMFASMLCLAQSAMMKQRAWQGINSIFVLGMLGYFWMGTSIMGQFGYAAAPVRDQQFFWLIAGSLIIIGTFFALAFQTAVAALTFESDNRSTGIRIVLTVQLVLFWIGFFLTLWAYGVTLSSRELEMPLVIVLIHTALTALYAIFESDRLTTRMWRGCPRNRWLRLLCAPWLPGGNRGLLLIVLHLLVTLTVVYVKTDTINAIDRDWLRQLTVVGASYILFYCVAADFVSRWMRQRVASMRPGHGRSILFLLVACGIVGPILGYTFDNRFQSNPKFPFVMLPNPGIWFSATLFEQSMKSMFQIVAGVGGFFLIAALPTLWRAFRELWVTKTPDTSATFEQQPL